MDPPTNSVAAAPGSARSSCRPDGETLPAKNVWMSPVMNVTSRTPRACTNSSSSRRSASYPSHWSVFRGWVRGTSRAMIMIWLATTFQVAWELARPLSSHAFCPGPSSVRLGSARTAGGQG